MVRHRREEIRKSHNFKVKMAANILFYSPVQRGSVKEDTQMALIQHAERVLVL